MFKTSWFIMAFLFGISTLATASLTKTVDRDWLTGADEQTRNQRLEHYLGGFSSAMLETGLRYGHVLQAVDDENWNLAAYHWVKIGDAVENGLMKRPARRANAEEIFLNGAWIQLNNALKEQNVEAIGKALQASHQACLGCHVAEKVPFINDQPLLRRVQGKGEI